MTPTVEDAEGRTFISLPADPSHDCGRTGIRMSLHSCVTLASFSPGNLKNKKWKERITVFMRLLQNGNPLISGSRNKGDNLQLLEYCDSNIQQDVFYCVIFAVWSVWSNKSQVAISEADQRSNWRCLKGTFHRISLFEHFFKKIVKYSLWWYWKQCTLN